jgi:hypothetical protein
LREIEGRGRHETARRTRGTTGDILPAEAKDRCQAMPDELAMADEPALAACL